MLPSVTTQKFSTACNPLPSRQNSCAETPHTRALYDQRVATGNVHAGRAASGNSPDASHALMTGAHDVDRGWPVTAL